MSLFDYHYDIDAAIAEFMAGDKATIHIVPKYGANHESCAYCWCIPDIEEFEETLIITHYTEH